MKISLKKTKASWNALKFIDYYKHEATIYSGIVNMSRTTAAQTLNERGKCLNFYYQSQFTYCILHWLLVFANSECNSVAMMLSSGAEKFIAKCNSAHGIGDIYLRTDDDDNGVCIWTGDAQDTESTEEEEQGTIDQQMPSSSPYEICMCGTKWRFVATNHLLWATNRRNDKTANILSSASNTHEHTYAYQQ